MIVSVVKYEEPQIIKNVHSAHLLPMRDWIRYVQRQCGSSDYGLHWFSVDSLIINTAMGALVSLHWLSGVMMLAVCITVTILSGLAVFRLTKSAAVVERIKLE